MWKEKINRNFVLCPSVFSVLNTELPLINKYWILMRLVQYYMSSCKINRMRIYYYFQEILVLIWNQRCVVAHLFKFTDMHLFRLLFWWCQLNFKALLSFLCRSCSVFTVFPLLFPVVTFENQLMIHFMMIACMAICIIPWSLLPSVAVQLIYVEIFSQHFHWPRLLSPFFSLRRRICISANLWNSFILSWSLHPTPAAHVEKGRINTHWTWLT